MQAGHAVVTFRMARYAVVHRAELPDEPAIGTL